MEKDLPKGNDNKVDMEKLYMAKKIDSKQPSSAFLHFYMRYSSYSEISVIEAAFTKFIEQCTECLAKASPLP
jgi:hypothetical protein